MGYNRAGKARKDRLKRHKKEMLRLSRKEQQSQTSGEKPSAK